MTTAQNSEARYLMSIDSGTTSVRTIIFDLDGNPVAIAQQPFTQYFPQPGWVEHDAKEILAKQVATMAEVQFKSGIHSDKIAAIGITNQRESVVVWDKRTGEPIANSICWQCRRTAPFMEKLAQDSAKVRLIKEHTGLVPDPYFSASKVAWILDNVAGARDLAEQGYLLMGTIDTWLIWNLTAKAVHATDPTNASRTMLFNIHTMQWDEELLKLFDIPASMLPEVRPCVGSFGSVSQEIMRYQPQIYGVAGDQQASLFGHCCFDAGDVKATYGTGCFILMNTGSTPVTSQNGLLTTVAASADGTPTYALEGSVFNAGTVVQWLRDELGIIADAAESEALALQVEDTGGVYLVPAFTGLGAPWWDANARGIICGITRGTNRSHIVRAALESEAYQAADVLSAMEADSHIKPTRLAVDGGGSQNAFTMQWQSNMLGCNVTRPACSETTALGAAYLAGLGAGIWQTPEELKQQAAVAAEFTPSMAEKDREALMTSWHNALARCR